MQHIHLKFPVFINLKEVNDYIKCIRAKFGGFNYAKLRTTFETEKLQDYLNQMIPAPPWIVIPKVSGMDSSNVNVNLENTHQNKKRKISIESTSSSGSVTQNPNNSASDQLADLWKRNLAEWENAQRNEMKKLKDENKTLKQEIAASKMLHDKEKMVLERKIADSEKLNHNLKQTFEKDKAVLEKRVHDLEEEKDDFIEDIEALVHKRKKGSRN